MNKAVVAPVISTLSVETSEPVVSEPTVTTVAYELFFLLHQTTNNLLLNIFRRRWGISKC